MYDYLIVGSGLFAATITQQLVDRGKKCLVIEKRDHIGGNCYTENIEGIDVHKYGPHIFHTNNEKIWNYINQFTKMKDYKYSPLVKYGSKLYSFPINLRTMQQLWGIETEIEARDKVRKQIIECSNPKNLEEWALSQVGRDLYDTFIYGYTKKQWGREPSELPSSIIKRLPIRFTLDDNYFNDTYQGIPIGGYTKLIENMFLGADIATRIDYLNNRQKWNRAAKRVIYTGPIDEFFEYSEGELEWRSLNFLHSIIKMEAYQSTAVINFTEEHVSKTRRCEHKHFLGQKSQSTVVTNEYPERWDRTKERYYPINDDKNNTLYQKYKKKITPKFIFGGRLAEYKYYDMHQVIGAALSISERI